MANPKCVALQCEIKDIFDKDLKPAVFKQIKQTVQTLVDKTKGLSFDDKCKDGWVLKTTVLSIEVDNADKPTSIAAKILVEGIPLDGSAHGFKANGGSKAIRINAKKMEEEAKAIVNDVLNDLMTKQVLPRM